MQYRQIREVGQYDHLPRPFSTAEIMSTIKQPNRCRQRRSDAWDNVKLFLVFCALTMIAYLAYWPIVRAFFWTVLLIAKVSGTFDGELPPYTPYPPAS